MGRLQKLDGDRDRRIIVSDSRDRTEGIGRAVGSLIPAGTVISLEGGLGAGKTVLAKGICNGLGIGDDVLSPSFILVEEYRGEFRVFHFDLYRLRELGEVEEVGFFDSIDGENVVIVEWGDRLPGGPEVYDITIGIRITGDGEREITITAPGGFLGMMEGEDM